jgi:hypothetical protein
MSWVCFSRLSAETPVKVISDLSGAVTAFVDGLDAKSAVSSVAQLASSADLSSVAPVLSRAGVPHIACVPVALAACLPWRPFFRSVMAVASPDSLQLRSTAPVDTAKDPEAVKEPAPSVAPPQVQTTQASSVELPKTQ